MAYLLAASPIPGDGLMYIDKYIEGAWDMAFGGTGIMLVVFGHMGIGVDTYYAKRGAYITGYCMFGIAYFADLIFTSWLAPDHLAFDKYKKMVRPFIHFDRDLVAGGVTFQF